jgi:hypothetical protein
MGLISSQALAPKQPRIIREIENADDDSGSHEDTCGNVWIDQFIETMQQKSAAIGFDAGPLFEPIFHQCQGTRQEKLGQDTPDERSDVQNSQHRPLSGHEGTEDNPEHEKYMDEEY